MLHLSPCRVAVSRPLLCAAVAVGWRNHSCFFSPRFQHLAFRVVGARPRSNARTKLTMPSIPATYHIVNVEKPTDTRLSPAPNLRRYHQKLHMHSDRQHARLIEFANFRYYHCFNRPAIDISDSHSCSGKWPREALQRDLLRAYALRQVNVDYSLRPEILRPSRCESF